MMDIEQLLQTYPRERGVLPEAYQKIYTKHYLENREGETKVSSLSKKWNTGNRNDFKILFSGCEKVVIGNQSNICVLSVL